MSAVQYKLRRLESEKEEQKHVRQFGFFILLSSFLYATKTNRSDSILKAPLSTEHSKKPSNNKYQTIR